MGHSRSRRADINVRQIAQLRARTLCDEVTIRRWAAGAACRDATMLRLATACAELGIRFEPSRAVTTGATGGPRPEPTRAARPGGLRP